MYRQGQNTMPNAKVSPIIFSTTSDLSAKYNKSQLPSQYANQSDDKNRTAFSELHSSTVQKTHLRMAEEEIEMKHKAKVSRL